MILPEWIAFYSAFLNIHRSGVLTALAWRVPQESAARESQSRRVLCTPYNHAPCHFMQSHIRKVYACLAVTYHLHFWQNDRGLLRATTVTWGWNGYRNNGGGSFLAHRDHALFVHMNTCWECLILRGVLNDSQWQLECCSLLPSRPTAL